MNKMTHELEIHTGRSSAGNWLAAWAIGITILVLTSTPTVGQIPNQGQANTIASAGIRTMQEDLPAAGTKSRRAIGGSYLLHRRRIS